MCKLASDASNCLCSRRSDWSSSLSAAILCASSSVLVAPPGWFGGVLTRVPRL